MVSEATTAAEARPSGGGTHILQVFRWFFYELGRTTKAALKRLFGPS